MTATIIFYFPFVPFTFTIIKAFVLIIWPATEVELVASNGASQCQINDLLGIRSLFINLLRKHSTFIAHAGY